MDGKKYKYHEPVQTPIAPPYAEALSLLENRRAGTAFTFDYDTDFNDTDINIAIENEGASSMAELKKDLLVTATGNDSKDSDTIAKIDFVEDIKDENKEEEATIVALQNLYMSEEAGNTDNTLM